MSTERIDVEALRGHTPGPWTAKWSQFLQDTFIVQAGMPSNRVLASFDGDGDGPDEQSLVDAHLIAAGPALLAEVIEYKSRSAAVAELIVAITNFRSALGQYTGSFAAAFSFQEEAKKRYQQAAYRLDDAVATVQIIMADDVLDTRNEEP